MLVGALAFLLGLLESLGHRNDPALTQKLRDFDQNTMVPFRRASIRVVPCMANFGLLFCALRASN